MTTRHLSLSFYALALFHLFGHSVEFAILPIGKSLWGTGQSSSSSPLLAAATNGTSADLQSLNGTDEDILQLATNGSDNSPETELEMLASYLSPAEGFFHATVSSLSVILVSELGDKTFFIAVVLAMRHSRLAVFSGALTALVLMTALSACLGQISNVIPRIYVHYVSIGLFIIFGLKMIKDGCSMDNNDLSEYDDVQKTIETRHSKVYEEDGEASYKKKLLKVGLLWIFAESFAMTFLAEWGDRSQITTIVLAARENMSGVIFGAVVGHAICTLIAVVGGRIVAERISIKAVTIIGGFVFLMFAVWAILSGAGEGSSSTSSSSSSMDLAVAARSVDVYQSALFVQQASR